MVCMRAADKIYVVYEGISVIKRIPHGKFEYLAKSPDLKTRFTFEAWCVPDARCIMCRYLPNYRGSLWLYFKASKSSRKYVGELRISDNDVMWVPVNSKLMYLVDVDGYTDDAAGIPVVKS